MRARVDVYSRGPVVGWRERHVFSVAPIESETQCEPLFRLGVHNLTALEWEQATAPFRTTLGRIVFRRELS